MAIIVPSRDFRIIKDVRLNRDGKKIGELMEIVGNNLRQYKGTYCHYTHRTPSVHFYRLKQSYGIQKNLLAKIMTGDDPLLKRITHIVIFSNGVKEKRYYIVPIETYIESDIRTFHGKNTLLDVEDYGEQKHVRVKDMQILGFSPDDITVQKNKEARRKWLSFGK